jgi:hypothetical protein
MSLYQNRKQKRQFVQEYAFVEDFSWYQPPVQEKKKDEQSRGVIEVDLDNGKTIQIT